MWLKFTSNFELRSTMRDANIISREGRARPLELMSMGHLHKIYLRKWTGLEIVGGHILIKWAPMVFHARLKICVLTSIMYSRANAKKLPVKKNFWPFLLNFQWELCPAFTNVTFFNQLFWNHNSFDWNKIHRVLFLLSCLGCVRVHWFLPH